MAAEEQQQQHLRMEGEVITPQKEDCGQQHLPVEGEDITTKKDDCGQQHLPAEGEDITTKKDDCGQQHLPAEGEDITTKKDDYGQQHLPAEGEEDITPAKDGGVLKLVKREGSGDELPAAGDKVWVHYVGTLLDGTTFDSSREQGKQFPFTLGRGEVIKAWDLGVATMRVGELCRLTCKAEYAYGAQGSPPKIPPGATLVFEVELFRFHGEDITEDGKVTRRRVVVKGEGNARPGLGTAVEVAVEGSHEGRVFDRREGLKFELGDGDAMGLPEGVEAAITSMEQGEESLFVVAPDYGFGSTGNAAHGIPGGAELAYRVRLAAFDKAKEPWEMSEAEKLEQSALVKEKGSQRFREGRYQQALAQYKRVLRWLEYGGEKAFSEAEDDAKSRALRLAAYLNLAACCLKTRDADAALENCDAALALDERSEKALFRRGEALLVAKEYERARGDFQKVAQLYPANGAARRQASVCLKYIREQREKDRRLYGRMFHKPGSSVAAAAEEEEQAGAAKPVEAEQEGKKEEAKKKEEEAVSMEVENVGGAEEVEKKAVGVEGEKAA